VPLGRDVVLTQGAVPALAAYLPIINLLLPIIGVGPWSMGSR
jgi:hypothetical protein